MVDLLAVFFLSAGILFFIGTIVGLNRFPDFYTRMHAAAKSDTLSTFLILIGFAIYNLDELTVSSLLVSIKLVFISVFVCITGPAASHALIDAGYEAGLMPWRKPKETTDGRSQ
jgi:multicomponent Na+:H+ antiporter subunit G